MSQEANNKSQTAPRTLRLGPVQTESRWYSRNTSAPGSVGYLIVFLSLILVTLAGFQIFGFPLLGKNWLSWMALSSLSVTIVTLCFQRRPATRKIVDLRQLNASEQLGAVHEVMHVSIATREKGMQVYRGYLLTDSQNAVEHLNAELSGCGVWIFLEPDDLLEARITLVPKPPDRQPPQFRMRWAVHSMLFLITTVTATCAGCLHQGMNPFVASFSNWSAGMPYALSLLTILGIHEAGHYTVAKLYNMDVTPPFFIPAPLPIGTFGAVISMRSPSRSRKVMFDTAAAGPLFGLLASLVFLAIGLSMTKAGASVFSSELLSPKPGSSLLFTLVAALVNPSLHYGASLALHPFAFAGWLGLLITAVNLIPVGQLDGGRIAHAVLGAKHGKILSRIALVVLMGLALVVWPNLLIFAILVMFVAGHMDRAFDDITPLGPARTVIGVFALLCLLSILLPVPAPAYHWLFDSAR